ncbi:pyrogallol hydroxytransferase small subunit BthL [Thermacetogenium phaeum DSM 12270]|uniref:Pyrogallol hydroxytransferase small subunit BthL n=1 Tax=Thermacetogenium phaeum (strain ATCC BAA-254 / DSM 26808 / PB) TaxID=1089553 RepID=K4LE88_THEPS|nr:4Fe-4S dicluster domain-containing protein [Thermacetogenium phaeum]AFV10392.1 pyrogallol hydroxytransferase small subunit BthL [Thermacetogenium phaeum DSM 12270]
MKVFVIDVAKCSGCYSCQLACKNEHVGKDWTPYAKPQPQTGHFWMKIKETEHGSIPKVKVEYRPTLCMHCDDASCIKAAKDGAVYRRKDGLVIIDPEKAKGQKQLVEACPYGAIYWNEELNIPQKCTGCAHLVDEGEVPRCVDACAHEAIKFGEEEELADLIAKAEVMQPELGLRPRVYYLNLPGFFVAGDVYDPVSDEIIEGAEITLNNKQTGESWTTKSDDFGDFWFKRLKSGQYSLDIKMSGYKPIQISDIAVDKSVNLGSLSLERE